MHNITICYCIFNKINEAVVIRNFFQKILLILNFWTVVRNIIYKKQMHLNTF